MDSQNQDPNMPEQNANEWVQDKPAGSIPQTPPPIENTPVVPQPVAPVQPMPVQAAPIAGAPVMPAAPQLAPNGAYVGKERPYDPNTVLSSGMTVAQEDKKAQTLCIWSLVCRFGAPVVGTVIGIITGSLTALTSNSYDTTSGIASSFGSLISSCLMGGGRIAAWVLVIVALAKYKYAKMPKVLLWVYIGLFVLEIVLAILAVFLIASAINAACN